MKKVLTFLEMNRFSRTLLLGLLAWFSSINAGLMAQDRKLFTHTADLRSGREDALLDIFKPISEEFENEYRALGTVYTTGEVLYLQKRFDDALRNYETVANKGKKYGFLADSARLRLAQTHLLNGEPSTTLVIGREVANS